MKAGQSVVRPEIWPQSKLSLQYAGKGLKFDDLTVQLFVAGFLESLSSDIKHERIKKVDCKLQHLKSLIYAASLHEWSTILELHTAIVLDIERGDHKWGDSNLDIQSKAVSSAVYKLKQSSNNKQGQKQGSSAGDGNSKADRKSVV